MSFSRLIAVLVFLSCGPDVAAGATCADAGTSLTYASFGAGFLSTYCTTCHGVARTEAGVNLTTEANASRYSAAIVAQAGTATVMPPAGSSAPSAAERADLVQW